MCCKPLGLILLALAWLLTFHGQTAGAYGDFEEYQRLTVTDVPEGHRLPGGGVFGTTISLSGNWCAIGESGFFDSVQRVHLFHWHPPSLHGRGGWIWRQSVEDVMGPPHLWRHHLLVGRADFGGLQPYRLVRREWIEAGEAIDEIRGPYQIAGDGKDLVVAPTDFRGTRSLAIYALDFSPWSGWEPHEVTDETHAGSVSFDREGGRIVIMGSTTATAPFEQAIAVSEYRRWFGSWRKYTGARLVVGDLRTGTVFWQHALHRGNLVSAGYEADALGNPTGGTRIRSSIFDRQGDRASGLRILREERTDGVYSHLAAEGPYLVLFGGLSDAVGNVVLSDISVRNLFGRAVETDAVQAIAVSGDGRWLACSDAAQDAFGNPIGQSVTILRR